MAGYPIELLDYDLPPELIAQTPLEDRAASRMLHFRRDGGDISHRAFRDFPSLLRAGDVLVFNDSKVIPGRIRGRKLSGGNVEIVVLKELQDFKFEVIAEVRGKMKRGDKYLLQNKFLIEVLECAEGFPCGIIKAVSYLPDDFSEPDFALSDLQPASELTADKFLEKFYRAGEMPVPPYIHERLDEPERYQTVYAENRGSAAAPTAGLHFTGEILSEIAGRGAEIVKITLHVGIGTFLPIRTANLAGHKMHSERYFIPEDSAKKIAAAKREGRRIIAIGTTAARTLETVFVTENLDENGMPQKTEGESSIFIFPPYEFNCVSAMLTNFHLPRSTLLAMIFAFAGRELSLKAYAEAVREKYRFFSFGDCMFIE